MRYRLPDDCAGVTLAGVALTASNGFIEADDAVAAELAPHGIVPAEPEAPASDDKAKAKRTRT